MVDQPGTYAIYIKEHLGSLESAFEDMHIQQTQTGTTLTAYFSDQAALHGVLGRIRDLCLTLIAVELIHESNPKDIQ